MALSSATAFEVRTTGDDTNGGGFVAGASGTDRSQQNAAHATLTTAATVHTTTTQINVPGGEHTVSAADVGNLFQINSGTATAGVYEITAVDVGNNRWTLDRSAGTAAQTAAGKMGGAFATPGKAAPLTVSGGAVNPGHKIWVKAGTYTLSTSTPGAGGPVLFTSAAALVMEGYNTTRGDRGAKPEINAGSVGSVSLITTQGNAKQILINLKLNGNSQAAVIGANLNGSNRHRAYLCEVVDCDGVGGFSGNGNGTALFCRATSCATAGFAGMRYASRCRADQNAIGFSAGLNHEHCLADANTGDGFNLTNGSSVMACTSHGNGGDGFDFGNANSSGHGCVSTGNTGVGYAGGGTGAGTAWLDGCADRGNSSRSSGNFLDTGAITLTADPYTNAAGGDFSPNTTSGGGAALRAAAYGIPGQTVSNFDIGAVQHADPAGGGGGLAGHPVGGYIG